MRFWDSSALVPLLVLEPTTIHLQRLYVGDDAIFAWWGAPVECASAVARLEREGALSTATATAAFRRLNALAEGWNQIEPVEEVRETAVRLLRVHDLRAANALQLAAAVAAAEGRPATLEVVCLDARLATAAQREGFVVLDREAILP